MKFLAITVMMAGVLSQAAAGMIITRATGLLLPAGLRMCSGLHAGLQSVRTQRNTRTCADPDQYPARPPL